MKIKNNFQVFQPEGIHFTNRLPTNYEKLWLNLSAIFKTIRLFTSFAKPEPHFVIARQITTHTPKRDNGL